MPDNDWLKQLARLLDEQIGAAAILFETLAEEKQALTGTSLEALNDSSARKHAQLTRFEQLEQDRRLLCQVGGIGWQRTAMEELIGELETSSQPDSGAGLRTRWQQLSDLISRCRDANETNGLIAQYKQRQLLQLLGLMRGGGKPGGVLYGADGGTTLSSASSRAIAQV